MEKTFNISDKVRVLVNRSEDSPRWEVLHRGAIVQIGNRFLRVYNPRKDSGDVTPDTAEWFPIMGNRIMIVKD